MLLLVLSILSIFLILTRQSRHIFFAVYFHKAAKNELESFSLSVIRIYYSVLC